MSTNHIWSLPGEIFLQIWLSTTESGSNCWGPSCHLFMASCINSSQLLWQFTIIRLLSCVLAHNPHFPHMCPITLYIVHTSKHPERVVASNKTAENGSPTQPSLLTPPSIPPSSSATLEHIVESTVPAAEEGRQYVGVVSKVRSGEATVVCQCPLTNHISAHYCFG